MRIALFMLSFIFLCATHTHEPLTLHATSPSHEEIDKETVATWPETTKTVCIATAAGVVDSCIPIALGYAFLNAPTYANGICDGNVIDHSMPVVPTLASALSSGFIAGFARELYQGETW